MHPFRRDPAVEAQGSTDVGVVRLSRPAGKQTPQPCRSAHPGAARKPTVGLEQPQRHGKAGACGPSLCRATRGRRRAASTGLRHCRPILVACSVTSTSAGSRPLVGTCSASRPIAARTERHVMLNRREQCNWTLLNALRKSEAVATDALDRLVTTLAVRPHACSACQGQHGWAPPARHSTRSRSISSIRTGTLRVRTGPGLPLGARTILVVAAHQPHGLAEVTRPGLGTQAMTEG